MNNKGIIVLALAAVIFLGGMLVINTGQGGKVITRNVVVAPPHSNNPIITRPSADTTVSSKSVKSSVEVVADNVKTSVRIQ